MTWLKARLAGHRFGGKIDLHSDWQIGRTVFRMPEEIAKANIDHFKKLLETETDAQKREAIERLLAEQQQKLATLRKRSDRKEG